ncbi:MAG: aldehyde dehydrogenase (NADP(+)), partial [Dinghuibacter sp.]|nr:aldehyde dehydrogenase (NADP(+)) [Dinghuibacter sp.]
NNPLLHKEVFGPYSLVVRCHDMNEVMQVARSIEGQLTATIMASGQEIAAHRNLLLVIGNFCGRLVFNGVPTGVEVCASMQHGGPFPATTDARFTAVGADGIKRFARPLAYQNCPAALLPDELKDENPLGIWRLVNGEWKNGAIG